MKRFISIMLCTVMIASALCPAVFAKGADVNEKSVFDDITPGSWYENAIMWCHENGYMNGVNESAFDPNGRMTRAMIAVIIFAVSGEDTSEKKYTDSGFEDVPAGSWYASAVAWAAEKGIVSGVSGTRFDPDAPVTREQLVLILKKYMDSKGVDMSVTREKPFEAYGDKDSVSEWAVEAVKWAAENDIISGTGTVCGTPYISPSGYATRAQIAVILKAMLGKNLGGDTPVGSVTLGTTDISQFRIIYGQTAFSYVDDDEYNTSDIADFLNKCLSNSCGITLPVYKDNECEPVEGAYEILIGRTNREDAGLVTVDRDGLGRNTLLYEMKDNYLILASNEDNLGTYMAARKFAEDVLGVTYYGRYYTGYSSKKAALIENGTRVVVEQDLNQRASMFHKGGDDEFWGTSFGDDEFLNTIHSLRLLACPGCEVSDDPTSYGHHLAHFSSKDPCLSSDENIDTIIKNVRTILEKKSEDINSRKFRLYVNQTDMGYYCRCDKCLAQYRVWGHSSTYYHILHYISDALGEEYPGVQFVALTHFQTTVIPKLPEEVDDAAYEAYLAEYGDDKYIPDKDITLPANAAVVMATESACTSHAIDDPDCLINVGTKYRFDRLCRICSNVIIGDYLNGYIFENNVYPNVYEVWQNMRYYIQNESFVGISYGGSNTDKSADFDDLKHYLCALLITDSDMTWEEYSARMNAFLKDAYGPGWTYLREYIDLIEKLGNENCFWPYNCEWDHIITPVQWSESVGYARYLFDMAESLAETEKQKLDIQQLSLQVKFTEVQLAYRKYTSTGQQSDFDAFEKINIEYYNDLVRFDLDLPGNWYSTGDPNEWVYDS